VVCRIEHPSGVFFYAYNKADQKFMQMAGMSGKNAKLVPLKANQSHDRTLPDKSTSH
jgi:hypothetical protein